MKPPLWVRIFLRLLLDARNRHSVAGDLLELFELRRHRLGELAARAWLRRQWIQYPRRLVADRLRNRGNRTDPAFTRSSPGPIAVFGGDLRHSLRSLARTPLLAATIIATVGLGIGATTAVFAVVDSVLLRPLPYPNSERIVWIYTDSPPNRWPFSVVDYRALSEQQTSFDDIAGYHNATITVNHGSLAEVVPARYVTAGYFRILGTTPLLGRLLTPADESPGAERTVVVSHAFWSRVLGGDADAVGGGVKLNGEEYTVVGVLRPLVGPLGAGRELYPAAQWSPPTRRGPFFISVLARLDPHRDMTTARDEIRGINRRIYPLWSSSYSGETSWNALPLEEYVVGDIGTTLLLVLGAAAFVMLIAASNAASLMVARATRRGRELALRTALGASRKRLLGHLLSESAVLAAGSALLGLAIAFVGIRLLTTVGAPFIPRAAEVGLSDRAVWFLAVATAVSSMLFGVIPALQSSQSDNLGALRTTGRGASDATGRKVLRNVLATSQFAVAAPLLIGAALLIGSLANLIRVDPGFDTENILTVGTYLPPETYPEDSDVERFWRDALERVRTIPGVVSAGYANGRPPDEVPMTNNFNLVDRPTPPDRTEPAVPFIGASPEFFEVLGLPPLEGRLLDERDGPDAPPVAVVDRIWADRFFPGENAVGRQFIEGGCTSCPLTTVVGVVGDVTFTGLDNPGEGVVYWPLKWLGARSRYFIIRAEDRAAALLPAIRDIVRELDPELPLHSAATIDDLLADSMHTPRYLTSLVTAFAAVALLLSVIGVYGVMSYHVQQQSRDIGIRIALGGAPGLVLRSVVVQGMRLVVTGTLIGVGVALALTRYMSSLLFQVGSADPLTFGGVGGGIVAVALAACLIPARRAARIDPVEALREE